jgi:hypothetical protein
VKYVAAFLFVVGIWALVVTVASMIFNAVAQNFGWPTVSWWLMAGILFLLGLVGRGASASVSK